MPRRPYRKNYVKKVAYKKRGTYRAKRKSYRKNKKAVISYGNFGRQKMMKIKTCFRLLQSGPIGGGATTNNWISMLGNSQTLVPAWMTQNSQGTFTIPTGIQAEGPYIDMYNGYYEKYCITGSKIVIRLNSIGPNVPCICVLYPADNLTAFSNTIDPWNIKENTGAYSRILGGNAGNQAQVILKGYRDTRKVLGVTKAAISSDSNFEGLCDFNGTGVPSPVNDAFNSWNWNFGISSQTATAVPANSITCDVTIIQYVRYRNIKTVFSG